MVTSEDNEDGQRAANCETSNCSSSDDSNEASSSLIKSPPSSPLSPSPSSTASTPSSPAAMQHERQTLLLMLLAQVCSLHDATPRTFVVHVLALFERGILDSNSIRFLFDLGLVPRGYQNGNSSNGDWQLLSGCFSDDNVTHNHDDHHQHHHNDDKNNASPFSANDTETKKVDDEHNEYKNINNGSKIIQSTDNTAAAPAAAAIASAIVPYAANNNAHHQHPWMRYLPPPPPLIHHNNTHNVKGKTNSTNSSNCNQQHDNRMTATQRQSQASAIRRHLEHQESIDGPSYSVHSSSFVSGVLFGSANNNYHDDAPGIQTFSSSRNYTSSLLYVNDDDDESLKLHHHHNHNNNEKEECQSHPDHFNSNNNNNAATHTTTQLATNNISSSSWSVEHHPLSLSRYQREFLQLSLLATGSFGSVYHVVHKLEHKPYAVKRVTFTTTGYYANTLALVIREVRCLAQLDHPNCVRYYTSWLEPSWMTGDQHLQQHDNNDDEDQSGAYDDNNMSPAAAAGHRRQHRVRSRNRPKLLPHIERVVNEINSTGEIPHSVQRLEAILYNGCNEDGSSNCNDTVDDGFEWDPVSSRSTRLLQQQQQQQQQQQCDDLPYHKTNKPSQKTNKASENSYYRAIVDDDDYDDDSDVSEWTQDIMNDNKNNSSNYGFERQGSLELVPADQHKTTAAGEGSPYKYQICLFIQMQLCHPTTLADWIKLRNHNCTQFGADERQARARPAFEAFRQIVSGLNHVHSKGIIHRDLKPANIFASHDDGHWMIGDFGLSKKMRDSQQQGVDRDHPLTNAIILPSGYTDGSGSHQQQHTAGVGTASYAAPEQISRKNYGPAVDIFSLGLILLELFSNFTSEHERAVAFHDCRHHGELAPWMMRTYPEVSSLVLACTQKDWALRPTASEILSASVFQEGLSGVEMYRAELKALNMELVRKDDLIQSQNDVIQSQNFELAEKDEIIQRLRLRLEKAGVNSDLVLDEWTESESSKNDC